jgi:tetratricopeptide (TPR) repeat protein
MSNNGEQGLASIPPKAREAIELARRGELARAILTGEAAVAEAPDHPGLRLFIGMLHARRCDLEKALPHLRRALALVPGDLLPRLELARVLIGADRIDEAEEAIAEARLDGPPPAELLRVRALLRQRRGAHDDAAGLYRLLTARDGRDFESWANLGACLLALGDAAGAVDALTRSLALRPDQPAARARLAEAQAAAGQGQEGLRAARALAKAAPYDPLVRITVARLEDLLGRPQAAEAALEEALALDPACAPALLALADLLERDNRIDELETLMVKADAIGVPPAETALLRARLLFRRGAFEAALAAARSAPEAGDGGARAQLIGRIADRLGDRKAAFAAFAEMNRLTAASAPGTARMGEDYRNMIARLIRTTTPMWYENWTAAAPPTLRPPPIFLFGFPRSGTTLLDTMLAGHPAVLVLEEEPVLHAAAEALGGIDRLASLGSGDIERLRARYFAALDGIAPDAAGKLVIDKVPLGIVDTALVHRIFPDARFIFAERHPCDVVLSGFMTRFDPKGGMANFLDLRDTAALYDGIMSCWRRCREVFPLNVHTIRYERMVEDPEGELRPLAAFLGLDWDPRLLDNCRNAEQRRHIATPSYAQVAEPVYTRACGRWEHYREEMAPVLPILAPWVELMDYHI